MGTPLLDRINARLLEKIEQGERLTLTDQAVAWNFGRESKRPAWLDRLTDQDRTGTIKAQR